MEEVELRLPGAAIESLAARAESFSTLPGEISRMRVWEKSAEVVVARKFL
jgi:hypothetical protein